jgi:putative flippase GtrA
MRRQLHLFLLVGAISTCLDFTLYFLLSGLGIERNISKGLSYLAGTYLGYLGNSKFTFQQRTSNLTKYMFVYLASLAANIWFHHWSFTAFQNRAGSWLIATLISTCMNFIGLRHFAFVRKV